MEETKYIYIYMIVIAECWTIAKEQQNRLEDAEMCLLKRISKMSGTHKVSNKDVLIKARSERSLKETMRKIQLEFQGIYAGK